ncbi:MAG: hybrid sensor histidine kinase/response regulator [Prevotella sp.]|jgi:two-component system sensor histidine kinase/response regulator|nr:hybrid sensor histidine kinase/response regulator [Prevotella sp.]
MKINHSDYKILVVDDVMTNILLLQVLLDKEGFNVITANNGEIAIDIITKEIPDLILLDVNMPNMDGFEVIKEIKKYSLYREIPVIFLTAINDIDSIVKGFKMGVSDYITKPFNKEELMARIIHQLSLLTAKRIIIKRTHVLKKTILDRDKMYSVIAHDLRSPMASMKIIMNSIMNDADKTKMDPAMYELLNMANKTTEDIFSLLDNLLKWTKFQIGKQVVIPQNIDLVLISKGIVDVFSNVASLKNIKIEFDSEIKYANVYTDIDMVKSCVRNLLSNAIKFSYEGGIVKVRLQESDDSYILSVTDNGCGISEANQQKLLNVNTHYTSYGTAQEEGSGLGLLLTMEFVNKNNGKLWFESKEGKGSTFFISLPKEEDHTTATLNP